MQAEHKTKYVPLLIMQSLFWGVGNPVMKIGMTTLPPLWCLFFRFTLGTLVFALIFGRKLNLGSLNRQQIKGALITSVPLAFAYITSSFSLKITEATISGFLMSLAVIFTPFLGWLLFRRRPSKIIFVPLFITMAGMYLLCGGGRFSFGWGELLALGSSFCSALMFITTERYVADVGPELVCISQTFITMLIVLTFALLTEPLDIGAVSGESWLCVVLMALFATCATGLIQNYALRYVSALTAAFIFCLEPIFSAISSHILLHERTSALGVVGAVLILIGVLIANILDAKSSSSQLAD